MLTQVPPWGSQTRTRRPRLFPSRTYPSVRFAAVPGINFCIKSSLYCASNEAHVYNDTGLKHLVRATSCASPSPSCQINWFLPASSLTMLAVLLRATVLANTSFEDFLYLEKASSHVLSRDANIVERPPSSVKPTLDWLRRLTANSAWASDLISNFRKHLDFFLRTRHRHECEQDVRLCARIGESSERRLSTIHAIRDFQPQYSLVRDSTSVVFLTTSNRPHSSRSTALPQYYSNSSSSGSSWARQQSRTFDASFSQYILPDVALEESPSPYGSEGDARTYHLEIIQQPEMSAEFGSAALSRLPLSPPLIVQLIIRDLRGNIVENEPDLPFMISHLSLHGADGSGPLELPQNGHFPPNRLLYGNLVSSPHNMRNLQGRAGVYFLFPDVSVRQRGRYSLQVTLMRLSSTDATGMIRVGESGTVLTEAWTGPFEIRPLLNYVAPRQTQLTEFFIQQGARIK